MRCLVDFWVFMCTLTGFIPSHKVRLLLYRSIFNVKIGKDTSIHWRARFNYPCGVEIGHNTIVGNDAFLDGRFYNVWEGGKRNVAGYLKKFLSQNDRPLKIGNNVSIAGEVRIFNAQHDIDDPHFKGVCKPVTIDDYVVIGTRVTILPGVHVGYGAVIASGAVVTRDVEPYSVVGGVPASHIRYRNKDLRYKLKYARLFQ